MLHIGCGIFGQIQQETPIPQLLLTGGNPPKVAITDMLSPSCVLAFG